MTGMEREILKSVRAQERNKSRWKHHDDVNVRFDEGEQCGK